VARLNQAGIHLLIVGVGSAAGLPIPHAENGRCRDEPIKADGKEVAVALRADILRAIAADTQGHYFGEGEIGELVAFLRERTLRPTPAHTVFSTAQRRDASWIFLTLATAALFGMIALGVNMSFDARKGMRVMTSRIKRFAALRLVVFICLTTLAFVPAAAFAHVTRADTQFSDIASPELRLDVGLLTALGIVPKGETFAPDKPLTRRDLAVWAALSTGKSDHDKKLDPTALAKAALAAGQVGSLEGDASFADLSRAFFKDAIVPDRRDAVPTRAEAVRFLAAHADVLLRGSALKAGSTGAIVKVEQKKTEAGGTIYYLTVGQTTLPMHAHGSVGAGPSDLSRWVGKSVRRTVIRTENGRDMWAYLEAAEPF
jgi:hypothetical protein